MLGRETQKGITLIALVITIVILLILAGIGISAALGPNGLIEQARESKRQTEMAEADKKAQEIAVQAKVYGKVKGFREAVTEAAKGTIFDSTGVSPRFNDEGTIAIIYDPNTELKYQIDADYYLAKLDGNGNPTTPTNPGGPGGTVTSKTIAELIDSGDIQPGGYINYPIDIGSGTNNGAFTVLAQDLGYRHDAVYDVTKYAGQWQIFKVYDDKIEIISSDNILEYDINKELEFHGGGGYNKLVQTLNKVSRYYINPTYATSARSVGSNPDDPDNPNTQRPPSYPLGSSQEIVGEDYEYQADEDTMNSIYDATGIDIASASRTYWLASRDIPVDQTFEVQAVGRSGGGYVDYLWRINSYSGEVSQFQSAGVRPIVSIRKDCKIINANTADGSAENPWQLGE